MDKLGAAIRKLSQSSLGWIAAWPGSDFDAQKAVEPLKVAAEALRLRVKGLAAPEPLDPMAVEKALDSWRNAASIQAISLQNLRLLCRCPETALHPEFLHALVGHPLLLKRRSWVESLLSVYFQAWRPESRPEAIEQALREVVSRFPEGVLWLEEVRAEDCAVIGPDAPRSILRRLKMLPAGLPECLRLWGLDAHAGLGRAIAEAALSAWGGSFRRRNASEKSALALEELRIALYELFPCASQGQVFYQVVEDLVLSEWSHRSLAVRDEIMKWALEHPSLGDPRRNLGAWHPIPAARAKVISWMARQDLTFFYDSIVPSFQDDQGRKAFWLQFVDQVHDFQLVLAEGDREKVDPEVRKRGGFSEIDGRSSPSAFLLRFKGQNAGEDLVCVEFSRSGNALFIYAFDDFEDSVGSMRARRFRVTGHPMNLKMGNFIERKTHQGDWQSDIRWFLNRKGIRPA